MAGNKEKGIIFNIQKFSIHDGEGIRTLIFMKGCPLRCVWCSNPESQKTGVEIMDVKTNCVACKKCVDLCPEKAIKPDTFDMDRELCKRCGICAKYCYANSKKLTGQQMTLSEIMTIIEKDRIFYTNSGGGVTIGGGEPAVQYEFVTQLLKSCRESNVHTAIETCGYGKWESIGAMFDYLDEVFYDLKIMDPEKHERFTGVRNEIILENARKVAAKGMRITYRLPFIPSINDDRKNIEETGRFVASLSDVNDDIAIEVLPYHEFGKDKYRWLNLNYELEGVTRPDTVTVDECKDILRGYSYKVI